MNSVGEDKTPGLIPISMSGGRVNAARAVGARGNLSPNGPGAPWVTCDGDHDGVSDQPRQLPAAVRPASSTAARTATATACATSTTTASTVPNADQADDDGDGLGNACDASPRGDDADGDGKPLLDDAVPHCLRHAAGRLPGP